MKHRKLKRQKLKSTFVSSAEKKIQEKFEIIKFERDLREE